MMVCHPVGQSVVLIESSPCTQAANLRGFRASVNPRFEAGIPDFMDGISEFMEKFNTF